LEGEFFTAALHRLTAARRLDESAERVHMPGSRVQMNEDEAASKQQIEQAFAAAGIKVPALKEVLAGVKIDLPRAQKIVTLLLREKTLVKISDELVFHQKTLEELKRQMAELKTASPRIDVNRFKECFAVSRKYAIPLLEYLDREHVTRRAGEERIIL
jgi:selenocysteine-specific elongation factor